jgi:uncharacterized protein with PQ loop repeat
LVMHNKEQKRVNLIFLAIGIIGSVFFIFFGYLLSGIIGAVLDENIDFLTAFCLVVGNPFDNYFNNITPVTMILGFIIYEGIYFLILMHRKGNGEVAEDLFAPDIIDIADKSGLDNVNENEIFNGVVSEEISDTVDQQSSLGYVSPGEIDNEVNEEPVTVTEERELFFSDEIVTDLLEDYDLSQIKSMLALKAHINIEDAGLLRRMFKPTMSAEEISNYIKMFYE